MTHNMHKRMVLGHPSKAVGVAFAEKRDITCVSTACMALISFGAIGIFLIWLRDKKFGRLADTL